VLTVEPIVLAVWEYHARMDVHRESSLLYSTTECHILAHPFPQMRPVCKPAVVALLRPTTPDLLQNPPMDDEATGAYDVYLEHRPSGVV
jgi:hypothetical protein